MLESYPTGLVSIVSDSYDIWNALSNIFGEELRGLVINRDGTLVIRPDSGHPVETPIRVIKELMNEFGYTWNKKGFKVLPDYLRVLQGDGIGIDEVDQICTKLLNSDISISNIAFGMGGGLLQKTDRDVLDYACKCSAIKIDGVWRSVQKDPITDSSKKSKKGLLRLIHVNGEYKTIDTLGNGAAYWGNLPDELHLIFSNGALIERSTLKEARERANK
jgi:nicotinamide phosphoribosyltransferase